MSVQFPATHIDVPYTRSEQNDVLKMRKMNGATDLNETYISCVAHIEVCVQKVCFLLVSFLAYSSALKMEATCSSETSVDSPDYTAFKFKY
jgi:hypothetical protein